MYTGEDPTDIDSYYGSSYLEESSTASIEVEVQNITANLAILDLEISSVRQELDTLVQEKVGMLRSIYHPTNQHLLSRTKRKCKAMISKFPSPSNRLYVLENQITETRACLNRLQSDRRIVELNLLSAEQHLANERNAENASNCAFRNLPLELLTGIFFKCLSDDLFLDPSEPLLLSHVCSRWRSLAFDTPGLWTSLSVPLKAHYGRHNRRLCLEEWLERSAGRPLSLSISFPQHMGANIDRASLNVILSTSNRWVRIGFDLSNTLLGFVLDGVNEVSNLECMVFDCPEPLDVGLPFPAAKFPALDSVTFGWKSFTISQLATCMPWHQLRHIDLESVLLVDDHIALLSKCRLIQTYRMRVSSSQILRHNSESRLFLPNLQSLDIVADVFTTLGAVLNRVRTPGLEVLTFIISKDGSGYGSPHWPKLETLSLVSVSSCVLQKMRFKGIRVHESTVEDIHASFPSLTSIEIADY